MNDLTPLCALTEAAEQKGIDIAPTYQEYMPLCFAIANDYGEAGREYFDRLCRLSAKYQAQDADRFFTYALHHQHRCIYHLDNVFQLAAKAGLEVKVAKVAKVAPPQDSTHTRVHYNADNEFTFLGTDPLTPLPVIGSYTWPKLVQRTINLAAQSEAQRDILFLTAVAVTGICLARQVRVLYGKHYYHPCFQLFVVAPPASGKGVMSFVRHLADPFHREIRRQVEKARKEYEQRLNQLSNLGKKKGEVEMPEKPVNKMFLIPGDNTGTGIMQNLIDSDGWGLIFEAEADTLSSAIDSEYGKWSDTLRNAFDETHLSYNRRGNGGEFRETFQTHLAVVVSGTPAQFKTFVKSAEDGTFSREIYYYMQPMMEWMDQLGENNIDLEAEFNRLGEEWKQTCDRLKQVGLFTLELTPEQVKQFNDTLSIYFRRSALVNGTDMSSAVKRMAIHLVRIMEVIALLRLTDQMQPEDYDRPRHLPLAEPYPGTRHENIADRLITHWKLRLTDEDFQAVLSLIKVMYAHTVHVLSFLPGTQLNRRGNAELDYLLMKLPNPFTTQDFLNEARARNIPEGTAKSWLHRLTEDDKRIEKIGRGQYRILTL